MQKWKVVKFAVCVGHVFNWSPSTFNSIRLDEYSYDFSCSI